MSWEIEISSEVVTHIASLDEDTRAKVDRKFTLIEEYGPFLRKPHCEKVGENNQVYEYKVHGKNPQRFYGGIIGNVIHIFHNGTKNTKKDQDRDIRLADQILKARKEQRRHEI